MNSRKIALLFILNLATFPAIGNAASAKGHQVVRPVKRGPVNAFFARLTHLGR